MKRVLRPVCFGVLGVAVLAASAAGTGLALTSRAAVEERHPEPEAEPAVVCVGHADVEGGIVPLFPAQAGRVAEVLVREAEEVRAGTVLLRLDDRTARSRVREAEADLRSAEAQLLQARQGPEQQQARLAQQRAALQAAERRLSAARHLLARKQALHQAGHIHADEVAAAADQVEELEASEQAERERLRELQLAAPAAGVTQAEADMAARRARLEQARIALDECSLRAPADGTVLRLLTRTGEVLGAAAKQPAVQFCPAGPRIVRAEVEQEFAGWVAVGQVATLTDDAGTGARWHGRVVRLSDWYTQRRSVLQDPLQFNDVRTLECIVSLDPDQPPLRIGQRVRVALGRHTVL